MKLPCGYVRPEHEEMDICALELDSKVIDLLNAQGIYKVGDLPVKDRECREIPNIGRIVGARIAQQRYILWKEIREGMYDHAPQYELRRRGYSVILAAITPNLATV